MEKQTLFVCPECGCQNVECTAWINANTDEIMNSGADGPLDDYWCPVCEDHVGYMETAEVEVEAPPTREDVLTELVSVLLDAREELRLCREKDRAGPYDPTLKARIDAAIRNATTEARREAQTASEG